MAKLYHPTNIEVVKTNIPKPKPFTVGTPNAKIIDKIIELENMYNGLTKAHEKSLADIGAMLAKITQEHKAKLKENIRRPKVKRELEQAYKKETDKYSEQIRDLRKQYNIESKRIMDQVKAITGKASFQQKVQPDDVNESIRKSFDALPKVKRDPNKHALDQKSVINKDYAPPGGTLTENDYDDAPVPGHSTYKGLQKLQVLKDSLPNPTRMGSASIHFKTKMAISGAIESLGVLKDRKVNDTVNDAIRRLTQLENLLEGKNDRIDAAAVRSKAKELSNMIRNIGDFIIIEHIIQTVKRNIEGAINSAETQISGPGKRKVGAPD